MLFKITSLNLQSMSPVRGLSLQIMLPIERIRSEISADVFDYTHLVSALSSYSNPRKVITSLLRKGQILRIKKGLYIFSPLWRRKPVNKKYIANIIYGPSAVSLDYALSWHGLIPERVTQITSVTTGRSRKYQTPLGRFSYTRVPQTLFNSGLNIYRSDDTVWLMSLPVASLVCKAWTDKRFRPASPGSYNSYLFDDLRINEETLLRYYREEKLEIAENMVPRKIKWLYIFLEKKFNSVL